MMFVPVLILSKHFSSISNACSVLNTECSSMAFKLLTLSVVLLRVSTGLVVKATNKPFYMYSAIGY